jgi:hypothetical protein
MCLLLIVFFIFLPPSIYGTGLPFYSPRGAGGIQGLGWQNSVLL